jgi:L-ascorbate metabolism protein UlaG (beta-lactamase superfamily)
MSETFHYNPSLPFIRENHAGNKAVKGRFVNEDGSSPVGFSKIVKWLFSANPQRDEKRNENFRLMANADRKIFSSPENAFSWLGHSAFLFRLNGKLLLTDPCLYSLPGTKRLVDSPYSPEELSRVDFILFSHTHRDHYDEKSVKQILRMNPDVHFLVPLKMAPLLEKIGAKNITEAGWYQEFAGLRSLGLRVVFLPARHWNRRWLHDTNRELWGSFHIADEKHSIYFAGDTSFGDHFREVNSLFPSTSHVFMPVGAYKPNYIMRDAHISPEEAADAFHHIGGRHFVPMHYGTYDLSDEPAGEPVRMLREMREQGKLNGNLLLPAVGETVFLQ